MGLCSFVAQQAEQFEAVELGEHDVEDNDVVGGGLGEVESFVAVGGGVYGIAGLSQAVGEATPQTLGIFNEEDPHGPPGVWVELRESNQSSSF